MAYDNHDKCIRYNKKPELIDLLEQLADRMNYTYEEFCTNIRIWDIQKETRQYYYRDTDQMEPHSVITVHYNEYSCEYHYNDIRQQWMKSRDYCYNTW